MANITIANLPISINEIEINEELMVGIIGGQCGIKKIKYYRDIFCKGTFFFHS